MKRIKHIALAAATFAMVGVTGSAFAVPADNGISTTKHNLSASSTASNKTADTTEICVFCHTPHGADTTQAVPLWNRELALPSTYSTYKDLKSSTLDGTIIPVGSVSLACLSCHDGTVAMDAIINTPGSGTIDGKNAGWDFTGSATLDAEGFMQDTTIAMLGSDLKNDHPVGVPYAGGGIKIGVAEFKDGDFKAVVETEINGDPYWYVDINGDSKRTRSDIILYTRDDGLGTKRPYVECASCHDPHVKAFDAGQVAFLRVTNEGSTLCLACHEK